MNELDALTGAFHEHLLRSIPRILTQLDRDPDSPTFGSFDRDYWHYRMRDFSSIVLQQGMLILDTLSDLDHPDNPLYRHGCATEWVNASLKFWASQQLANGSFNEYYPFEEGYPPTAFSLLAVILVFRRRGFTEPDLPVKVAIQKACDWLLDHPEQRALNQESAGLAGLALAARIPGIRVDAGRLELRLSAFFQSQSVEGWFPEYVGPDLGYLSETIDCLWDYHETTGDQRAMAAMERAVQFMSHFIPVAGDLPVMTNSRNTDYIVPYGLVRMAASNPLAARIVRRVFRQVGSPDYFLAATDDRYTCHYVYQSFFRALQPLADMIKEPVLLPCENEGTFFFSEAGMYICHRPGRHSIFVAGNKGGVVYLYTHEGLASVDYGWRWKLGRGKVAVTHWQGGSTVSAYAESDAGQGIAVEGRFSAHGWHTPTPFRHLLLRVAAFVFGNSLIALLKETMIFKAPDAGVSFRREITVNDKELVITDVFSGAQLGAFHPEPAPHYSLRHVASAGNFSREELTARSVPLKVEGADNLGSSYVTTVPFP